jgi:dihydroneopterin aldolase
MLGGMSGNSFQKPSEVAISTGHSHRGVTLKTVLRIPVIAGKVHLGCLPKERKKSQKVETEIKISFAKTPPVCKTDSLEKTPCYAEMSECLAKVFKKKHYATIEHLGMESFENIKNYLKNFPSAKGAELYLNINKVSPPIKAIKQGSHFSVTDFL